MEPNSRNYILNKRSQFIGGTQVTRNYHTNQPFFTINNYGIFSHPTPIDRRWSMDDWCDDYDNRLMEFFTRYSMQFNCYKLLCVACEYYLGVRRHIITVNQVSSLVRKSIECCGWWWWWWLREISNIARRTITKHIRTLYRIYFNNKARFSQLAMHESLYLFLYNTYNK